MAKLDENPKKQVVETLLKKVNTLLNKESSLKLQKKELEKIISEALSFLKSTPPKNPLNKQALDLYSELKNRLDKID
jgi:hypothetical protein